LLYVTETHRLLPSSSNKIFQPIVKNQNFPTAVTHVGVQGTPVLVSEYGETREPNPACRDFSHFRDDAIPETHANKSENWQKRFPKPSDLAI
jgi:hypothetical protein